MAYSKEVGNPNLVLGIDLGTTNSCVAVWEKNQKVLVVRNEYGSSTIPSVVSFLDDISVPHIGDPTKMSQCSIRPENIVKNIKRIIVRNYDDDVIQYEQLRQSYTIKNVDNIPNVQISRNEEESQDFTPEEISSMILDKIKQIAEAAIGKPAKFAIITVPVNFNNQQRKSTKQAAEMAGLHVLRIINEPTAAAVAYGLGRKYASDQFKGKNVLVFDLGGGTFDVSILSIDVYDKAVGDIIETEFTVMATGGDMRLGGTDFDNWLADHVCKYLGDNHNITIFDKSDGVARMVKICEDAKIKLSTSEEVTLDLSSFAETRIQFTITRLEFENLCSNYFDRMIQKMDEVIHSTGSGLKIQEVVFVGGATRMPKVKEVVRHYFKEQQLSNHIVYNDSLNPDETVATGAAGSAVALLNLGWAKGDLLLKEMRITDIIPNSIGIQVFRGKMSKIVARHTQIPCTNKNDFIYTTVYDNQTSADILVFEGEDEYVKNNNFLGHFRLDGIPKAARGEPHVSVFMNVDANGVLDVVAREKTSGVSEGIRITELRESHFINTAATSSSYTVMKDTVTTFELAKTLVECDAILIENWETFYQVLLPSDHAGLIELRRKVDGGLIKYVTVIQVILRKWVAHIQGQNATTKKLQKILRDAKFVLAADCVIDKHGAQCNLKH